MTNTSTLRTLLLLLFAVACASGASGEDSLVRFGLTLPEFRSILMTEADVDFGMEYLPENQSSSLWAAATDWQWQYNIHNSSGYSPYIVCDYTPNASGYVRIQNIQRILNTASSISPLYVGDTQTNGDDRSCVVITSLVAPYLGLVNLTSYNDTIYLEVMPMMASMKMSYNVVNTVANKLSNLHNESSTSISLMERSATHQEELVLELDPCPGVSQIDGFNTTSFGSEFKKYLINGTSVSHSDFFVNATNSRSLYPVVSDRMSFWSNVMENVTSGSTDKCLNLILANTLILEESTSGTVYASLSNYTGNRNVTSDEFANCVWYSIRAMALHPYVCRVATKLVVTPIKRPNYTDTSDATRSRHNWWWKQLCLGLGFFSLFM